MLFGGYFCSSEIKLFCLATAMSDLGQDVNL